MARIPEPRIPAHPGKMLLEEFLIPNKMSQEELADAIGVPVAQVTAIIAQRSSLTPMLAIRLSQQFQVSNNFWLNLQTRWDLYNVHGVTRPTPLVSTTPIYGQS